MNLVEMRARTRQDLEDTDSANYRWVDDEVDGAIQRVVREFSLAYPQMVSTAIATTDGSTELDISSLSGLIAVESVEFPIGEAPPYYQHLELWGPLLYMQDKGNDSDARVRWYKEHTLLGTTAWAASTAYALGAIVIPTANNGLWYECTTAGTSGTAEPAWPTTEGATVGDNTATWTCRKPTIPAQFEEIIVLGATGYLAASASAYTVDKASIAGKWATINFLKWGQERLELYQKKLKAISRSNRIISKEFYGDS